MTVVICQRSALFREALATVVASRGHHVVGCGGDVADALCSIGRCRPDVVLLDASLVERDTVEQLDVRSAGFRLILLADSEDDGQGAARAVPGADRVLDAAAALKTLERAVAGRPVIASTLPRRTAAPAPAAASDALTERERQVIELLVAGSSTEAISAALRVAHSTVHSHVQGILRKLGARGRVEAVNIYLGERGSDLRRARR